MNAFIFLTMLFCNVLGDFTLHEKYKPYEVDSEDKFDKNDWMIKLFINAISWSFLVCTPIAFGLSFNIKPWFMLVFFVNMGIHIISDILNYNMNRINLIETQIVRVLQIITTFCIYKFMII